ncbi:guanylate kinase [Batrachochytrium dendrobatidis JEL423]|uniref:Guanylate kinase n=1 Tax=Batrachochytrium dendrobatidis (strain JEL423) TaxID=403673 RepID=A0A177WXW9_BATDL|nr:guanylate kinase [Batrachochytrium dendrobatidis JEL423]
MGDTGVALQPFATEQNTRPDSHLTATLLGKSRSKETLLSSSTHKLSKDKSKSVDNTLALNAITSSKLNIATAVAAEEVNESSEAKEQREAHELVDEYYRRIEMLSLPVDMLKKGLSHMGLAPIGHKLYAGLNNISALREYPYIQNLELQGNNITDITALGSMQYLVQIDLSSNRLTDVLAFDPPPHNLQQRNNRITTLKGIETLLKLEQVQLSKNAIVSVEELKDHPSLRSLDIESNFIADIDQVYILVTLPRLHEVRLRNNPFTNLPAAIWYPKDRVVPMHTTTHYPPSYRLKTVFLLQKLTILDSLPVSPEEKVAAVNTYDPPQNVIVAVQHAHMEKKQAWSYARIRGEDLMRARRLRPLVLCGPNGAGKRTLTSRLLKEFPHIYGLTVSHTTRRPRPGEENGVHYHFVSRSEMEKLNEKGEFIQIVVLFGNMYGTSMDAVDKVTKEGKICIMDLELEGLLALRKSKLKPRFIYVTTPSMEVLQERLQARLDTPSMANKTTDLDASNNFETPEERDPNEVKGWLAKAKHTLADHDATLFDFTVMNDDLERAYKELKEYCLGMYWKDFEAEEQE